MLWDRNNWADFSTSCWYGNNQDPSPLPNLVFKFPLVVKTCVPCIFLQVVGIEMNASAVLDAQRNAEINGIKNCRFVCSKVRIRAVIHIYLLIYII